MTTRPETTALTPAAATARSHGPIGPIGPIVPATPRLAVRGLGLALSAVAALSLFAGLTESMHVVRLAQPLEVVQLDRVTVYGESQALPTAVVRAESGTRSN